MYVQRNGSGWQETDVRKGSEERRGKVHFPQMKWEIEMKAHELRDWKLGIEADDVDMASSDAGEKSLKKIIFFKLWFWSRW